MTRSERELLVEGCELLGLQINNNQADTFLKYMKILLEWNKKVNITAITDTKQFIIKHFLDSLSCIKSYNFSNQKKIIDVGTGGGFPGLPIKIMIPDINLTLLDSIQKRIIFLEALTKEINLQSILLIHGRAEDYGRKSLYREKYDVAVSRAVAPFRILLEYCLPFVNEGGIFIVQKSADIEAEIKEGTEALKILGGQVEQKIDLKLPFSGDSRSIIIVRKIKRTPDKYPRRVGIPQKRPL